MISRIVILLTLLISVLGCVLLIRQSKAEDRSHAKVATQESPGVLIKPLNSTNGIEFNEFTFLGNDTAWAAAHDRSDANMLLFSTDGGRNWQSRAVNTGGIGAVGIDFADSQLGLAVGRDGLILRTTDGGTSWKGSKVPNGADFDVVKFANSMVAYVAGGDAFIPMDEEARRASHGFDILRTKDGGSNWDLVYHNANAHNAFAIAALSVDVVFVVDGKSILRTEDAGMTWKQLSVPVGYPCGLKIAPDGTIWVVGRDGCFFRSSDRGDSWVRPANISSGMSKQNWWDLDFVDSRRGVAVGDEGACVSTFDGGNTWLECGSDSKEGMIEIKDNLSKIRFNGNTGLVKGSLNIYEIKLK